jgi:hypothetical protein
MTRRYDSIPSDDESLGQLITPDTKTLPDIANTILNEPLTLYEQKLAIRKGKRNKAVGPDGMSRAIRGHMELRET